MASIIEVIRPTDLDGLLPLLADPHRNQRVLAGGTDLLLKYQGQSGPDTSIIDVTRIGSLSEIVETDGGLRVGITNGKIKNPNFVDYRLPTIDHPRHPGNCYRSRRATRSARIIRSKRGRRASDRRARSCHRQRGGRRGRSRHHPDPRHSGEADSGNRPGSVASLIAATCAGVAPQQAPTIRAPNRNAFAA